MRAERYLTNKSKAAPLKTSYWGTAWLPSPFRRSTQQATLLEAQPLNPSLLNQIYQRIKGTSFEAQNQIKTEQNTALLWQILHKELINKDWIYDNRTIETLKRFSNYINSTDTDGKTILHKALDELIQPDALKKIIDESNTTQEVADKIYSLMFPPYHDGEYGIRNALDTKRQDLIRYIDALIEMGALLGDKKVEKLLNILRAQHTIIRFLVGSRNPLHKRASGRQEDITHVGEVFAPLTPKLIKLTKKEGLTKPELNFDILDLRARTQTEAIFNKFNIPKQPEKPQKKVPEDL